MKKISCLLFVAFLGSCFSFNPGPGVSRPVSYSLVVVSGNHIDLPVGSKLKINVNIEKEGFSSFSYDDLEKDLIKRYVENTFIEKQFQLVEDNSDYVLELNLKNFIVQKRKDEVEFSATATRVTGFGEDRKEEEIDFNFENSAEVLNISFQLEFSFKKVGDSSNIHFNQYNVSEEYWEYSDDFSNFSDVVFSSYRYSVSDSVDVNRESSFGRRNKVFILPNEEREVLNILFFKTSVDLSLFIPYLLVDSFKFKGLGSFEYDRTIKKYVNENQIDQLNAYMNDLLGEKVFDHFTMSKIYFNKAMCYLSFDDLPKAEECLENSVSSISKILDQDIKDITDYYNDYYEKLAVVKMAIACREKYN
ncbi:MAG: hypothetical protein JXR63_09805 [Spirochaetales bacterium]|nr:hypothetical protein [Spirochaetales bacterium]